MISPEEFVTRWHDTRLAELDVEEKYTWGISPLVSFDDQSVARLSIPDAIRNFLVEAGLPMHVWSEYNGWRFGYPSNALPPITEVTGGLMSVLPYSHYFVLGVDVLTSDGAAEFFTSVICLDLESGGTVVEVISYPDHPIKFLNSSVCQLAEFILLWRQMIEWEITHQFKLDLHNFESWNEERVSYRLTVMAQMRQLDPPVWQPGLRWYELINEAIITL